MEKIVDIEVTHLDGFGIGVIEPTGQYTDDEVAAEVHRTLEPVQDAAIICIDERHSAQGHEPVRRKTVGGGAMSGTVGALLSDWPLLSTLDGGAYQPGSANKVFDFVAEKMSEAKIQHGAHTDNHATPESGKTHCGGMDSAEEGIRVIAEVPGVKVVTQASMGDEFDEKIYDEVVQNARRVKEARVFSNWDPRAAQDKVRSLGGVVEVLDGEDYVDMDDPDNKRHGHGAQGINLNKDASKSSNRDTTDPRYFNVDESAINEISGVMGRNTYNSRVMKHGIVAYNAALAYLLTKDQRFTQT